MARDHARLLTRIWSDKDFRALTVPEQHAYMMVLSDPALTYAGTTTISLKRWAGQSAGATPRTLRNSLDVLCEKRFHVIDWETEEILVRSLLRRDRIFRQPNVAKSAYTSWEGVLSPVLRAELLFEVHRVNEGPATERNEKTFTDEYIGEWLREPLPEGLPEGFFDRFRIPVPKGMPRGERK